MNDSIPANPYAVADADSDAAAEEAMPRVAQALQQAWQSAGTLTVAGGLTLLLILFQGIFFLFASLQNQDLRWLLAPVGTVEIIIMLPMVYPVRRLLQFRQYVEKLTDKDDYAAATQAFAQLRLLWRHAVITLTSLLAVGVFAVLALVVFRR